MKKTKRKGFNFFRSYFDVYNELENDSDKLAFIDALLNRQFLGIKPNNLKGMAKFAYISQVNSIDSQVKGFEDKTGIKLTPCQPPNQGGVETPSLQVEEKVEEKEKEIILLHRKFCKEVGDNNFDSRIESLYARLKVEKGSLSLLLNDFKNHIIEENRLHLNTNEYFKNFKNWLNTQDRYGKLEKYKKQQKGML